MQIYETFVNQSKFGEKSDLYRSYIGVNSAACGRAKRGRKRPTEGRPHRVGKRRGAKRRAARDETKRSGSASEDGQAAREDGQAAAQRGRTGREEDGQAAAQRDTEDTGNQRQGKDPAIPPQGGRVVIPLGEKPP